MLLDDFFGQVPPTDELNQRQQREHARRPLAARDAATAEFWDERHDQADDSPSPPVVDLGKELHAALQTVPEPDTHAEQQHNPEASAEGRRNFRVIGHTGKISKFITIICDSQPDAKRFF